MKKREVIEVMTKVAGEYKHFQYLKLSEARLISQFRHKYTNVLIRFTYMSEEEFKSTFL